VLVPLRVQEAPLLCSAAQGGGKLDQVVQWPIYVSGWHALAPLSHQLLFGVWFLLLMASAVVQCLC
jgi:hypothetical protein